MRDLLLAAILAGLVPMSLFRPWVGVLTWVWVSLMSPHLQAFGFMAGKPIAMLVGVATLAGIVFSKDPRRMSWSPPVVLLLLFTGWMAIVYPFSLVNTSDNLGQLEKVFKINFMTLVAVMVLHTRRQVDYLIAVVVVSLGFFGVKGGLFTLLTGGSFRVRGEGGFIGGNNEVGLALIMTVPLIYYLILITQRVWWRRGLWAMAVLNVIAALGTQSRGALLGILAMTTAFLIRSPKRAQLIIPIVVLTGFVLVFMPESWWQRMDTISSYNEDASALGRINAWMLAFNVARSNLFGGGFTLETDAIFAQYAPNPHFIAVAHSIYFQVLGQLGFIGLAIYLAFWASVLKTGRWVARNAWTPDDVALARMIEVSLIGFAVGGAFLNLAYFDGPYYLMVALVVMRYKLMGNAPRPAVLPETTASPTRNARIS